MAFSAAGLNCIAVGPTKLYIYNTTDTISGATLLTTFNTTNCPGMDVGDVIIAAHDTNAVDLIRITAIDATSCVAASASSIV